MRYCLAVAAPRKINCESESLYEGECEIKYIASVDEMNTEVPKLYEQLDKNKPLLSKISNNV